MTFTEWLDDDMAGSTAKAIQFILVSSGYKKPELKDVECGLRRANWNVDQHGRWFPNSDPDFVLEKENEELFVTGFYRYG